MVTNLEFEGGVTAAFSIEGCVSYQGKEPRPRHEGRHRGRRARDGGDALRGRAGHLGRDAGRGRPRRPRRGRDVRLVRDLVQAVSQRRQDLIPTTLHASMESHLMGFLAEESRVAGGAVRAVCLSTCSRRGCVEEPDPFAAYHEALEARHLADSTFAEVRRAAQALPSVYLERRGRMAEGAVFDGAGKRAAFAREKAGGLDRAPWPQTLGLTALFLAGGVVSLWPPRRPPSA